MFSNGSVYDFTREYRYYQDGNVVNAYFSYNDTFKDHHIGVTLGGNYDDYSGPGGRIAVRLTTPGADFTAFTGRIEAGGGSWRIGDRMRVHVARVDFRQRRVDFVPADRREEAGGGRRRKMV